MLHTKTLHTNRTAETKDLPVTADSANFKTNEGAAKTTLNVDTSLHHRFTRGTQRVQ